VEDASLLPLKAWESFYVIVGSSAAALTGLMFVVITLMADRRQRPGGALDAFGTPTIVHFCGALAAAAIVSAPWPSLGMVAWVIGIVGIASVVYVLIVNRRARRQSAYQPVLEDWIWHIVLPLMAYLLFIATAIFMTAHPMALFGIGAGSLLLVFIGIHNAWDTVTYIALDIPGRPNEKRAGPSTADEPATSPTAQ
jgi:hypothetical protein